MIECGLKSMNGGAVTITYDGDGNRVEKIEVPPGAPCNWPRKADGGPHKLLLLVWGTWTRGSPGVAFEIWDSVTMGTATPMMQSAAGTNEVLSALM